MSDPYEPPRPRDDALESELESLHQQEEEGHATPKEQRRAEQLERRLHAGASMRVSEVVRIPSQSVDPSVKNYHWLDLDLALLEAYDHGADLVVLRDLSGAVTEGPGYNVFAHVDGRWLTPGRGTLQGITRRSVIELARQAGHQVEEDRLTADDLYRAAEVLVTSTAGGIMPVTVIDGQPVGTGAPGPLTRQLRDRYWASHEDPRYSTPVRYDEPG